ncbi:phage tail protein [Mixta theicola]|uniref:Phage tail protein n=1 Tax=Mixta theicola TaxID=1458355 RepID=A0A2K1QCR1_9GAMM|nr:tail fiber assembly protein [Mixta theicola]PNS12815.1 phage tail protein [Mixta theicola]GLR09055.1 tail fiber protein [Mixta theicola]
MKTFYSQSVPGFYVEGISNLPEDAKEISETLWQQLLEGQSAGKIIDFTSKPPALSEYVRTPEDYMTEATAQKTALRLEADNKIAPLDDAIALGIATDEERASYDKWRKYRVLLNRVDISAAPDITWPISPVQ